MDPNIYVQELTQREKQQIDILQNLLNSYFDIVRKSLQDTVTKIIWRGLGELNVSCPETLPTFVS